ncbi:RNA polymerase III subunit C82 [Coemansia sp. RSA 2703]|nr:RNA polymerase III subunit C82 [Coemansia sp. RSA 2703]
MFTQQVDLCRRIIREHFGPIVEKVVTVLIGDGRLPLGAVIRKTGLSPQNTRQALAVLIQHSIVTHAESKEGSQIVTFYSVNLKVILRLKRVGLYMGLVDERIGKEGLAIFRTIMANGMMSIANIRSALGIRKNTKANVAASFDIAVNRMVKERFITAVTPKDTVTKIDRRMQEEAKLLAELTMPPTNKQLMEIRRKIADQEDESYFSSAIVGIKRAAVDSDNTGRSTKMRVHDGPDGLPVAHGLGIYPDGQSEADTQLDAVDEKVCFRPYYDRLDVLLRNHQIANHFIDKYNVGAGIVVKAILRITEPQTRTCRDKTSNPVSVFQIIGNIPADAQLADSVDTGSDMFFKRLQPEDDPMSPGASAEALRKKRSDAIFALLDILHNDSSGIVAKVEEQAGGQYRINFERAAAVLRDRALDSLIQEKFGAMHARIVRVLRDKQKLDEKTVSQTTMLPIALCRERLHDLALSGLIDTFDIPRTADRNPSRMFYLWFVNPEKQVRSAMSYIFQGMSNLHQRIDHEMAIRSALITKTKRKDVIADPSLLTEYERKELKSLMAIKQNLEAALIRLDGMLLIIHDINPHSSDLQLLQ